MTGTVPCGTPFDSSGVMQICNVVAGHIGGHQYIPGGKALLTCLADVDGLGCLRLAGHQGEHSERLITARALDNGDRWAVAHAAPRTASTFTHCGERITWYEPGTDTCTLRAGHAGMHAVGPGDYIGGRTMEDVLVEALKRISVLEERLSTPETGTDTGTL